MQTRIANNNKSLRMTAGEMSQVYFSSPTVDERYVIYMPDDSMSGTIEAGEALLVKKQSGNLWDAIYFYELDGRYFVKRLQTMKNKLMVISDNKHYENWEATSALKARINILGMVTARCQIHMLGR